jgi:6-phosphogluconolactonase
MSLNKRVNGPMFHLALLGLGADGHTVSLLPGSPALQEHESFVTSCGKGPEGWERVPLTFKALLESAQIWFIAAGKEKQSIIKKLIKGPWDPLTCPAQGLRPKNGNPTL